MIKILINNEEVVCNNNIQIKEEMLSTSSTILKNCYPKTWENDKNYVSRYYFPKDYSKCKITNDTYHPEEPGTIVKGSNLNINYNNTKRWELNGVFGNTLQNGTPTPSSPVPIQNVTGLQNIEVCGKNLFDGFRTIGANATYSNGILSISSGGSGAICNSNYFVPSGNRTYYFSYNSSYATARYYVAEYDENYTQIRSKSKTIQSTFTIGNDTKYFAIIWNFASGTTFPLTISNIQLEQGSTATSYEPYKGNTYEVNLGNIELNKIGDYQDSIKKSTGKNLFDKDNANILNAYFDEQTTTITSNDINRVIYIPCKPNATYTITKYVSPYKRSIAYTKVTPNIGVQIYDQVVIPSNGTTGTITTGSEAKYLVIRLMNTSQDSSVSVDQMLSSVMINEGSTSLPYEPFGKVWYIEKNIGKVVLNGSENWILNGKNTNYGQYIMLLSGKAYGNENLICDRFITAIGVNGNKISGRTNSSNISITIEKSIVSYNVNNFKTWLSTHNTTVLYQLATPTYTEITNTELIEDLETIYQSQLYNGINNISVNSENLSSSLEIHYNFNEEYTIEDLIFCGCIKNTGRISLNPREPHFVDLQVLDFKILLSEGETLNYVITGKTIVEAINQVVNSISDYGFIVGNIQILNPNDIINAYSTLNKTAYDVFQYIADITQSRWTTRMIDENTIAIDFYDPTLMPQADPIMNTKEYMCSNKIDDISFNYSTNDYRNKQIMTSDEVYGNILQTETLVADGYLKLFMCENKIGEINSITLNGTEATFMTKSEEELGASADFVYQPGENTFSSTDLIQTGGLIVISYYPIVKGREIIINPAEINRINEQILRNGAITRYENRNDTTSSAELQKIGQSYIKYKGKAEINLKIKSEIDLFNVGQIVEYQAPLEELTTDYMVKSKTIDWYVNADKIFYTYELTSNYNYENAINYFDNQRAKNQGNIGEGETITRNIDLESTALILFYDTNIEEIEVENPTSLDFALDGVFI